MEAKGANLMSICMNIQISKYIANVLSTFCNFLFFSSVCINLYSNPSQKMIYKKIIIIVIYKIIIIIII